MQGYYNNKVFFPKFIYIIYFKKIIINFFNFFCVYERKKKKLIN